MLASDTYVVTTLADTDLAGTADDDEWSLREAILHSENDDDGVDVIRFDPALFAGGEAVLLLGDEDGDGFVDAGAGEIPTRLQVDSDLTIEGPGADLLTIDAGGESRGFYIDPWHVVTLTDMTVSDGSSAGSYGGGLYGFRSDLTLERTVWTGNYANKNGGAVYLREGNLTVIDSTFDGNTTSDSGGGVFFYNTGSTHHELLVSGSTFSHNSSSGRGHGLVVYSFVGNGASALVTNSTFSNNSGAQGGAVWIQGSSGLDVEILNSTIAENHTTNESHPGGVWNNSSTATLTINNSIIAGNTDGLEYAPSDIHNAGVLTGSHNLYVHSGGSYTSFEAEESNEKLGNFAAVKLAPLGDYGGPTETHALLPGSPAIDEGDNNTAAGLANDQRAGAHGVAERVIDGNDDGAGVIDIGAVEYGATVIEADERFLLADLTVPRGGDQSKDSWVASNASGDSVTAWLGYGPEDFGVYVQQINPDTADASLPRLVGIGDASSNVGSPRIAIDSQGNYAVVWTADDPDSGQTVIWMRRYSADGSPVDALPLQVTDDEAYTPSVEVNEAGQIVLAWKSGEDLYTRRYTTAGLSLDAAPRLAIQASGTPITINSSGRTIAVDGDGTYYLQYEQAETLYLQVFAASGVPQGTPVVVASDQDDTLGDDALPDGYESSGYRAIVTHDMVIHPDGGVLVAWSGYIGGDSLTGSIIKDRLFVRRVDPSGQLDEPVIVTEGYDAYGGVNDGSANFYYLTTYTVSRPSLAVDGGGRIGFAWERDGHVIFTLDGYSLPEPEIDEYGNPYWTPDLNPSNSGTETDGGEDTLLRWFTADGASVSSQPIVLDAAAGTDPILSASANGEFLLTTLYGSDPYAQRFRLPNQTSFVNGVLTIDDSAAIELDEIVVSTLRVDGDRYVAINGVATDVLAASVTKLVVNGSAAGNRIDLSRVDGAYFTDLLVDPMTLVMPIEVYAGDGADLVTASPLGGSYYGEGGEDQLSGNIGVDYLYGGYDDDTLSGAEGNDRLFGEAGDDLLLGNAGDDSLEGGDDDDQLVGGTGLDQLWGNSGNDRLDGGQRLIDSEVDALHGGLGDDVFIVTASGAALIGITDDDGNDTVDLSASTSAAVVDFRESSWTLETEGTADVTIALGPAGGVPPEIENVVGTEHDDVITGNDGDNRLYGGGGNDTIDGGGGNDVLLGGLGDDIYCPCDGSKTLAFRRNL